MWLEIFVLCSIYLISKLIFWAWQRHQSHQTFVKMGVKGPKPNFFSGNIFKLFNSDKMHIEVFQEWFDTYGDTFGYFEGGTPHLVTKNPDTLQKILIKNVSIFRNRPDFTIDAEPIIHSVVALRDDEWKRVRRVISPVFMKVTTPEVTSEIESCIDRTMNAIRDQAVTKSGSLEIDVSPVMNSTSLDMICRIALELNANVHDQNNEVLKAVNEFFSYATNNVACAAVLLSFMQPIISFFVNNLNSGKMTEMVVKHIKIQIEKHMKSEVSKKTFFGSLVHNFKTGKISKEQVIGNSHFVLLAGYETTSTAMTFMLYYLSKYQDVQDKLREYFQNGGEEDYFEKTWLETLRFMPPLPIFVTRHTSENVTIDGLSIQKGTVVSAPVYQLHHSPDLWEDPEKFDPDLHFSNQARKSRHPMAFMAFGAGPRICLGMAFATQEARLVMERILLKYQIEPTLDRELKLKAVTILTNPAEPVVLKLTPL